MRINSSSEPPTTRESDAYLGKFITRSAGETFGLAKRIGEQLSGGEVFLLKGDLGAGKTVFAKGLAAGLEIDPSEVTSPTFTLVNPHQGRLRLYHVDLYRLDAGAHQELGLEEILDDEKAVTVIEWAERLSIVPARGMDVEMLYLSDCERSIKITRSSLPSLYAPTAH